MDPTDRLKAAEDRARMSPTPLADVRVFELPDGSWVAEEDVSEDLTIVGEGRTREEALEELRRVREVIFDGEGG